LTLANLPSLIDLDKEKKFTQLTTTTNINSLPATRFLGTLNMSGQVDINSSSLMLPTGYDLKPENITLMTNQKGVVDLLKQSPSSSSSSDQSNYFNNTLIRELKLYGKFQAIVNSTNLAYLPAYSNGSYITLSVPVGSTNMTLKLFNGARAEFLLISSKENNINNNQQKQQQSFNITGEAEIQFHKIKSDSPDIASIPILMKNPEIKVNGKAWFQKLNSNDPKDPTKPWAPNIPVIFEGTLVSKFDHIDIDRTTHLVPYITYIKWVEVDGEIVNIAEKLKKRGLEIPWENLINTVTNTKILVTISIIALVSTYLWWSGSSQKKNTKQQI
jgi:hypothetical protein